MVSVLHHFLKLDEWRVVLGKSWKYQSKLSKAGTILKLLNALSGI